MEAASHPLNTIVNVPDESFEELIDDVDIVITDSPFLRASYARPSALASRSSFSIPDTTTSATRCFRSSGSGAR